MSPTRHNLRSVVLYRHTVYSVGRPVISNAGCRSFTSVLSDSVRRSHGHGHVQRAHTNSQRSKFVLCTHYCTPPIQDTQSRCSRLLILNLKCHHKATHRPQEPSLVHMTRWPQTYSTHGERKRDANSARQQSLRPVHSLLIHDAIIADTVPFYSSTTCHVQEAVCIHTTHTETSCIRNPSHRRHAAVMHHARGCVCATSSLAHFAFSCAQPTLRTQSGSPAQPGTAFLIECCGGCLS